MKPKGKYTFRKKHISITTKMTLITFNMAVGVFLKKKLYGRVWSGRRQMTLTRLPPSAYMVGHRSDSLWSLSRGNQKPREHLSVSCGDSECTHSTPYSGKHRGQEAVKS